MHGTNPKAELRASSFKGLMRYWWRAIVNSPITRLKEKETEIFGGTSPIAKKSKFTLILQNLEGGASYNPLPHRKDSRFTLKAIPPDKKFKAVVLSTNEEFLEIGMHTLKLASLLGGFGQRARRGFGAIQYKDFQSAHDYIEEVFNELRFFGEGEYLLSPNEPKVTLKSLRSNKYYPYLTEVEVTKKDNGNCFSKWEEAVKKIGEATHRYRTSLLGSVGPRFASPYWVGVKNIGEKYCIVISKVNPAYPNSIRRYEKYDGEKILGFEKFLMGIQGGNHE